MPPLPLSVVVLVCVWLHATASSTASRVWSGDSPNEAGVFAPLEHRPHERAGRSVNGTNATTTASTTTATTATSTSTSTTTATSTTRTLAARAAAADVPSCQPRTGRQQMVVVKAPVPYFSWQQCNDLVDAGKGHQTEPINATKHAGVVTLL